MSAYTIHDYWVDGHYIASWTPAEALVEASALYGYQAQTVRTWTEADQAELDRINV